MDTAKVFNHSLPISKITVDPRLQMRAQGNSQEHVDSILEALNDRQTVPRIETVEVDGIVYVFNGFQRLEAYQRHMEESGTNYEIQITCQRGSWEDAVMLASQANKNQTALKRSNDDKRKACRMLVQLLANRGEIWTNGKIAKTLGVSLPTVSSVIMEYSDQLDEIKKANEAKPPQNLLEYREEEAKPEAPSLPEPEAVVEPTEPAAKLPTFKLGKDGKKYPVGNSRGNKGGNSRKKNKKKKEPKTPVEAVLEEQATKPEEPTKQPEPEIDIPKPAPIVPKDIPEAKVGAEQGFSWREYDANFGKVVRCFDYLDHHFPWLKVQGKTTIARDQLNAVADTVYEIKVLLASRKQLDKEIPF